MNENSTMLYKYPGNDLKVRVRKDGKLVYENFEIKIVPCGEAAEHIKNGWFRKPQNAFSPPEMDKEEPEVVVINQAPRSTSVIIPEEKKPVAGVIEEKKPEEFKLTDEVVKPARTLEEEPQATEVDLEDVLKEIDEIGGKGAKKRLIAHAKDFGIILEKGNFNSMKKDYKDQLEAKHDNLD